MSTTIAELLVKIGVSVDGAKKAEKELEDVGKEGKDIGEGVEKGTSAGRKALRGLASAAKRTGAVIQSVGAGAKTAFGAIGIALAAVGAAATAAFAVFDRVTGDIDAQKKLAEATGLTYDEFQRLSFATTQSGADTEQLSAGLRTLRKELVNTERNGAGPVSDALDELNIGFSEIKGKSAQEQLGIIGDALNKVEDRADRTRLAAQFFGEEAGPRLSSLLAEGSKGIDKMAAAATVLTDEQQQQATAFQDSIGELKNGLLDLIAGALQPLIPVFTDIIKSTKEWFQGNEDLIKSGIGEALSIIRTRFSQLWDIVKGFLPVLKKVWDLFLRVNEVFNKLADFIFSAIGALGGLTDKLTGAEEAGGGFAKVLDLLLSPIDLLSGALGLLGSAIDAVAEAFGFASDEATNFIRISKGSAFAIDAGDTGLAFVETGAPTISKREQAIQTLSNLAKAKQLTPAQAKELIRLGGGTEAVREFAEAGIKKERGKGGKGSKKKTKEEEKAGKEVTSDVTFAQALLDIRANQGNPEQLKLVLQRLSKSTPSTKDIKPTVAIDFFNFNVTQHITGVSDPVQAAEMSNQMLVKFFKSKTAKAGQALTSNVVR